MKSWRVDQFIPYAKKWYGEIEEFLNTTFYRDIIIKRYFSSQKEINDWSLLQSDAEYQHYIGDYQQESNSNIRAPFGYGLIKQGAWLDCMTFLEKVKGYLIRKNRLVLEDFKIDYLDVNKSTYRDISFEHIVFCEGYRKVYNPLFSFIPKTFAKGEVLVVKSTGLKSSAVLNKNFIILPLGGHLYKVGATFSWEDCDFDTTENGKENLSKKLSNLLKTKYEIVDHLVGIRPTSKDRRPILGRHPIHNNVSIFNGLGTKGVSMAPLCADHLCGSLLNGQEIEVMMSVKRFSK